jgi:arginyl-tRNA synthetase
MNILGTICHRFRPALEALGLEDVTPYLEMIKPGQDPQFGDYQANCAMSLAKKFDRTPRAIAEQLISDVALDDLCEKKEVAGPGFINLTLRTDWLEEHLSGALSSDRLGIPETSQPRTIVIDYSAPNVAKPMHVGHIRSTVIGDALAKILRFLGDRVVTDNHIGDWGTQFGMIIYGYKYFLQSESYSKHPVGELARLYQQVNQLVQYRRQLAQVPVLEQRQSDLDEKLATLCEETNEEQSTNKSYQKQRKRLETQLAETDAELQAIAAHIRSVEQNIGENKLATAHPLIEQEVLLETAKLHAGDPENMRLWSMFMPVALAELDRVYQRLGISFEHTLGESFYHDRLAPLVTDLQEAGIAQESDGAICIFSEGQDVPMIIQKKDGAYLYATTDLATIDYRLKTWNPDTILYVVDHRQSLHFEQLFSAVKRVGWGPTDLVHVKFGTVLGEDGRPFKTRSGSTVGLDSLLNEAVARAAVVAKANNADLDEAGCQSIAEVIGIGALKYADLCQNRGSDYVFSYDKMLALNGNTATYLQYAYARIQSILRKANTDIDHICNAGTSIRLCEPAERSLGLAILRFSEALTLVASDYRPNHLTHYLFENLAKSFSHFFEQCPVIKADSPAVREQRILLCELTARTLKMGLSLLGIEVVEQM